MLTPVMGVAASETGKAAICPILPSLFPVYLLYSLSCPLSSFDLFSMLGYHLYYV